MAYFANGSEGEYLAAQCADCPLGETACPVLCVQLNYNYDQIGIPKLRAAMNLLIDAYGDCQVRKVMKGTDPC